MGTDFNTETGRTKLSIAEMRAAVPRQVGELATRVKPKLRGVSHKYAFFAAILAGSWLVATAPPGRARFAVAVYAASVVGLFGASALYHRVNWSDVSRRWMRRLDHSMIFVLIAGTYTPVALLALSGTLADVVLVTVWGGALAGIVMKLFWIDAPKWLGATIYLVLGWTLVLTFPEFFEKLGLMATVLLASGGALYTSGAVIYALKRPDPAPAIFGYHEIFHAFVITAAALQYLVIALYVVPKG